MRGVIFQIAIYFIRVQSRIVVENYDYYIRTKRTERGKQEEREKNNMVKILKKFFYFLWFCIRR